MKYDPVDNALFCLNRDNFRKMMKPDAVAFFHAGEPLPRSGDQAYPFRQNSDFFYLSGIEQQKSILMLFPDSPNPELREVLFLQSGNEHSSLWEGDRLSKQLANDISGVETICWLTDFEAMYKEAMVYAQNVYLNIPENPRAMKGYYNRDLEFARDLKNQYPAHKYLRANPSLTRLRMVKSVPEQELIKMAVDITGKAILRVMKFVKPGVGEYEVEAEIIHEYIRNRAGGHAFHSVVASGQNACVLHYNANNRICKDGDLLLIDTGAEYANYAGDISRTIPVNGRFSRRQKKVYDACLRVMKFARELLVPGSNLADYHKEVMQFMEKELMGLGLFSPVDVKNQDPENPLVKKYFPHGTSHYLGLDVHDEGNRYVNFQPGMVLTCEPGIYIREEGIGVRIENNLLITENGPVDLSFDLPLETEEIEEIMNS